MLTLEYKGDASDFDVDQFLLENSDAIRLAGIQAIKESHALGLDEAHAVEIIIDDGTADFILDTWEWMAFLHDSIEPLLSNEDYESLVTVRELMRLIPNE